MKIKNTHEIVLPFFLNESFLNDLKKYIENILFWCILNNFQNCAQLPLWEEKSERRRRAYYFTKCCFYLFQPHSSYAQ